MADLTYYTKGERRRLARYACGWCDQRLDKPCCGAIYEPCTEETRAKRRADCLRGYKPRRIVPEGGGDGG